jgi:PIN domain nuclease of toxin-antitoxin system
LDDPNNILVFSTASLWEIVIKPKQRDDFAVDPRELRRALLDNGYEELAITSLHAFAVEDLPPIHKDPFDRMLVAQARMEGITLLTMDVQVLRYLGSVQKA